MILVNYFDQIFLDVFLNNVLVSKSKTFYVFRSFKHIIKEFLTDIVNLKIFKRSNIL